MLTIDLHRGTVGGVGLGSSQRAIERRFGRPVADARGNSGLPTKAPSIDREGWPTLVGQPPKRVSYRSLIAGTMRYERMVFDTGPRIGAYYVGIADPRMRTREGVRYGDSLETARRRYPFLRCGIRNEDSEDIPYPYCKGRTARGVSVWFGQDPIRSISVARTFMG